MNINVTLDEHLTSNGCVKLVIELLKYILYQKQQMPFAYESLSQLQMKPTDRNSSSIKTLLNTINNISDHLNSQFRLDGCKVKEIAILIGATIISPKLHVRVEFPSDILSSQEHFECKHNSRKPLLNLMRAMLECSEFQDALTTPLNPTNTFVLIRKSDSNSISEFFLPKPQYTPPVHTSNYFVFKLQHNEQIKRDCSCIDLVKVYSDLPESNAGKCKDVRFFNNSNANHIQGACQWYQSREAIKGCKFLR